LFETLDCLTISSRHFVKSVSSDEILVAILVCSSEAVVAMWGVCLLVCAFF
jgi:hypothetical protein